MVRIIVFNNINWASIYQNLREAHRHWGTVSRVMVKIGAAVRVMGIFYKPVVQMVLIYRCDSCLTTDSTMKVIEGLHHHITWRLVGKIAWCVGSEG